MRRQALVACLLSICLSAVAHAVPYRVVALTGQSAPNGFQFSNFYNGVINDAGMIAFTASVQGPGVNLDNAFGVWGADGRFRQIMRSGDPGISIGPDFAVQTGVKIDAEGRAAFFASAPNRFYDSFYSEGQGSLRLVSREGDQAPDEVDGVLLDEFPSSPLYNKAGRLVFRSVIVGPGNEGAREGLWSDRTGSVELVISEGKPAPEIPGANLFQLDAFTLNDHGLLAFAGRYSGGQYPNDFAIWTEQGGDFSILVRSGDAAIDSKPGVEFGFLSDPSINNAGQVLFKGSVNGLGVGSSNDEGIWRSDASGLRLVAREGDDALADAKFGHFANTYLNAAGKATFYNSLVGPTITTENNGAIWSERGDDLALVAREGTAAPGTAGLAFGDLTIPTARFGLQANGAGQVAFPARLTGPGVTFDNDVGVWATDPAGRLNLIVREGDLIDMNVDPAIEDLRTVTQVAQYGFGGGGGEDGMSSIFNDKGELLIAVQFDGPSAGLLIFNTVVPEPSPMLLAIVFAAGWRVVQHSAGRVRNRRSAMAKQMLTTHAETFDVNMYLDL